MTRGRSENSEGRSRSSTDRGRKRRRSSDRGSHAGKDEGSRKTGKRRTSESTSNKKARRRTSRGEGGSEERGGGRKARRERKSTCNKKKVGSFEEEDGRGQNKLNEGDRRSTVEKKNKICFFFQDNTCTRGDFCNFSHDIVNEREQLERRRDAKERRKDPDAEVLYLQDKTFTVKTLDIKEHFTKFGDVVKVKFIGKQERGNLFKVLVPWYLGPPPGSSSNSVTISGVKLEVESTDGNFSASHGVGGRSLEWSSSRYDEKYGTVGKRSKRTKLWGKSLGRDRQVDKVRQGREATKGNSKGDTSSGRSRKDTEHSRDEDFPTCPVCDRVFNRGSSWRDNEHAKLNHMKKHDVGEDREQEIATEITMDHGPEKQPWSPFRGEVLLCWIGFIE